MKYTKPEINVVKVELSNTICAASGEVQLCGEVGDELQGAKGNNDSDWDEEE